MATLNAYYSGDTVAATVPDETGNGFDATLVGGSLAAAEAGVPGPSGIVLAAEDYLDIPPAALPAGGWSVSWWASFNAGATVTSWPRLAVAKYSDGATYDIFYDLGAGAWKLWMDDVATVAIPSGPVLFVITATAGGAFDVYIDDMVTPLLTGNDSALAKTLFRIGAHHASGWGWAGQIDEIAAWSGLLSETERTDLLSKTPAEVGGLGAPPIAPTVQSRVPVSYRLTLTGAPDATTDLLLPCVSLQARLRSGSQSYFSAVLPYTPELAAGLAARPNGDLILEHVAASDTTIITVPLDSVQPIKGVNSASINITGWRQSTNSAPVSHDVQPITTTSGSSGKRSWSGEDFDPAIRPADTINFDGESVIIDTMTLQISIGREAVQYSEA